MKFMLVMFTVPDESSSLSEAEIKAIEAKHKLFRDKYEKQKILINGAGLVYRNTSTAVEMSNGDAQTSKASNDGNEPEMTAYYVVESKNQKQAESIAKELLDDHVIRVEVREIHHSNGF